MCILAATDHLHAAKTLVVDQRVLHVAAPASLARGALENAATAIWLLHPAARNERVERTLRWQSPNMRDAETALGQLRPSSIEGKLERIRGIASARGIPPTVAMHGYKISTAVQYAEQVSDVHVVFSWQMCSGLAHGRPWAYLGVSQWEVFDTEDPLVANVRLTSSMVTTLYPSFMAVQLMEELLRLFTLRSSGRS
jgi:hypothetical protein